MDKLLKDDPALKEEYDDADDERRDEIKDELRSKGMYKLQLRGALNQLVPERKKKYEALPAKEKRAAAAALVVEFCLQRGLSRAAKKAPGASVSRCLRPKEKMGGENLTARQKTSTSAPSRPYAPLLPAHLFALHTAFHSAAKLRSVCELSCMLWGRQMHTQRRRRRRRGCTTRQHAFLNGRSCAISSWTRRPTRDTARAFHSDGEEAEIRRRVR
jgi:putative hemolysin